MMTSDAKTKLSKTIRALRERLLTELSDAVDREYLFTLKEPKLDAKTKVKRQRLEDWLAEQVRTQLGKVKRTQEDFRRDAEKQAAYTLLNRLVILRIMEAVGLRKPHVVTGGWNSQGYKDFRELAQALVHSDDSEGFAFLLQLIFEDLAIDLPGLYGSAGVADLIPVPTPTIRAVVEALDDEELKSCWTDDMTLGWVYQYWNDPEREALDAKINDGGKIEPHEIASKTQMFTERYMVDWLLQNSLGPMWLAMCQKHGWTPDVVADGTLDRLEQRRAAWRAKRDAGEVALTDLMPLETEAERRWAYYVPQPIPDDAVEHAPKSVRDLKILDPAVGSGHFLVVAFDLLFALYKEEAKHRGESPFAPRKDAHVSRSETRRWDDQAIVERILEHNLHGIDLDPRAVQIAAAALWLKAQNVAFRSAKEAGVAFAERKPTIRQLNLVASNLGISRLADNDPSLVELRRVIEAETGIPGKLTMQIVEALRGADHLGSLLKIDQAIEAAIATYEEQTGWKNKAVQITLFPDGTKETKPRPNSREWATTGVLSALENFLSRHTSSEELGLRLAGEQLAAGVRFVRILRERQFDIIAANPPYQGTNKLRESTWYEKNYPLAKTDLFAGMTIRALDLLRPSGTCAMIALSNWMYIKSFVDFRTYVLSHHLSSLADLGKAAFSTGGTLISTACYVIRNVRDTGLTSVAIRPMSPDEVKRDVDQPSRCESALRMHRGRYEFEPAALKVVPEWPLVYWWDDSFLANYGKADKLGDLFDVRQGLCTGDNTRALRKWWESQISVVGVSSDARDLCSDQVRLPFMKGGEGNKWFEPLEWIIDWRRNGFEIKVGHEAGILAARPQNEAYYMRQGIAVQTTGSAFAARFHRFASIFGDKARSVFPADCGAVVTLLNSTVSKSFAEALNPTIDFTVGDLQRIPFRRLPNCDEIFDRISSVFATHESHREPSVEFKQPGPSPWRHAQEWAQLAVDRPEGAPLPEYVEERDPEPPTDHLSYAVGVALGRFGANGEGILDSRLSLRESGDHFAERNATLPNGILFLDGALGADDPRDSLGHTAAQIMHDKWSEYGSQIDKKRSLRDWLRERFFPDVHKGMYENRPIHWPLSSAKKTFVAWVTIHRWNDQTLRVLLADHLEPALKRLDGEITDLTAARNSADKKQARGAEDRYADVKAWRDELAEFIRHVQACAERGPEPPDPKKPEREVDARYIPDLDDGVMINSAALWPLLQPQWRDPQKWWKELVAAKGKKDYDWSHLAMRYWPTRVDEKCQQDPSLGVAHGCFWKYHPARAWAWELRLQDEIGPDFRIEEASYRGDGGDAEHRTNYLRDNPTEALEAIEKEVLRRKRKQKKPQPELTILEPGLWSAVPDECWELELKLTDKQQLEFRLLAPDEPESRAKFEKSHPDKVKTRKSLLGKLRPPDLFADQEDEDEESARDDAEDLDTDDADTGEVEA